MSLNGYAWVEGNTPNGADPSGLTCYDPFEGGGGMICLETGGYGRGSTSSGVGSTIGAQLPRPIGVGPIFWVGALAAALCGATVGYLVGQALGGNISYSWIDEIPDIRAGEGDWAQAIPRVNEDPPENCNDARLIGIRMCNNNLYQGFSDAFEALIDRIRTTRGVRLANNFDSDDWDYSNTCDGGVHWNIPGSGGWTVADGLIASIRCCPCCDDSFGIPFFSWNCELNIKF